MLRAARERAGRAFSLNSKEKGNEECDVLTTSHITSSEMWIGCNHEDHAVQNLNMQITQLQLTT